jgi:uncharacterized protein
MEIPPAAVSLALVAAVSAVLVVAGLRRQPGLGILAAVVAVVATLWLRGEGPSAIGFGPPSSWGVAVGGGFALAVALQLLAVAVVEPWAERLTGSRHDHGVLAGVAGSWTAFLLWLVVVWGVVVIVEEGIFRGFLMTELARALGSGPVALTASVLFTSFVFGLSHAYQGPAGVVSTGIVGAVLGAAFVASGFNVWLVVFAHGFVNTIGIGLVAAGFDQRVRPPRPPTAPDGGDGVSASDRSTPDS